MFLHKLLGFRSKVRFFVRDMTAKSTQLLIWWTNRLSEKLTLAFNVSTTLPRCFCKIALVSCINLIVCWCKSFVLHLHTAAPSNVNLGHTDHMPLHLLDKTLVLANSLGGSLDTIVYKTSCGKARSQIQESVKSSEMPWIYQPRTRTENWRGNFQLPVEGLGI